MSDIQNDQGAYRRNRPSPVQNVTPAHTMPQALPIEPGQIERLRAEARACFSGTLPPLESIALLPGEENEDYIARVRVLAKKHDKILKEERERLEPLCIPPGAPGYANGLQEFYGEGTLLYTLHRRAQEYNEIVKRGSPYPAEKAKEVAERVAAAYAAIPKREPVEELEASEKPWQHGIYYHGFPVDKWYWRYKDRFDWERFEQVRGVTRCDPNALRHHLASGKITISDLLDTRLSGGPPLPTGFANFHMDPDGELDPMFIYEYWKEYDKDALARLDAARKEVTPYARNLNIAKKKMEESAVEHYDIICRTLHVVARTVDAKGEQSGYLLHFEVDDQPRSLVILDEWIETGAMFKRLAAVGFIVESNKRAHDGFKRIVREAETCARVHIEPLSGWYGDTFLSPTGEAITGPDTDDCSDPERFGRGPIGHALHPDVACDAAKGGTLDQWHANVVKPSWSGQTPQFAVATILGLGGVILQLADAENFVAYPFGRTTGGKSTTQNIAAGCTANPAHGKGTLADAGADDPAIRAARTRGNGTSWGIDGKDGSNATRVVATIRDGAVGTGGSVLIISSEKGPLDLARQSGAELDAGVLVRLLPIDLGVDVPRYRIDPRQADAINAGARTHHGHALAPLVRRVLAEHLHEGDDVRIEVAERADKLLDGSNDPELHRAAQHVGVLWVTGELMQDAKLLPDTADVPALMRWLWEGYLAFRGAWQLGSSTQGRQARERIEAFAESAHVCALADANGLGGAWGWRDGRTLYVRSDKLLDVLGPVLGSRRTMRGALGAMLMLPGNAHEVLTWRKVPGVGYVQHYRISLN